MQTLSQLRSTKDMTQMDLAVWLGVTPSTVYNWERGRSEPRSSQLKAIAILFCVSMDSIEIPEVEVNAKKLALRNDPKGE
jgi:DNA-binding XRE family transcriptional regulator